MNPQSFTVLLILTVSCGSAPQPGAISFPQALQDIWQLSAEETIAVEATPELVRSLGLEQARRAIYDGPDALTVIVYQMNAEMAAFELQQKWQPEDGRLTFYTGPRFVILESPTLDHPALAALGQAIEQHWKQ